MAEKRYKGNKYVYCYCTRHEQILVGTEIYKYLNIFAQCLAVMLTPMVIISDISITYKLIFVCLFSLPAAILPYYEYRSAKKVMLKAGHADECSRKIARMAMTRASLWGDDIKIMKEKDD